MRESCVVCSCEGRAGCETRVGEKERKGEGRGGKGREAKKTNTQIYGRLGRHRRRARIMGSAWWLCDILKLGREGKKGV